MNDIFGRVVSVLLCVWLMFFYPLWEAKKESVHMEKMYLYQETVRLVDHIRNTGVAASRDVENYLGRVAAMNSIYRVEISCVGKQGGRNLLEELENVEEQELAYNDFVKVVVEDGEGNMAVCYGGSVKAEREVDEVEKGE